MVTAIILNSSPFNLCTGTIRLSLRGFWAYEKKGVKCSTTFEDLSPLFPTSKTKTTYVQTHPD